MRATDPVVTFLLVLVIGIVAGILFDRLAGPSWLSRQFSGSTRGIITSALKAEGLDAIMAANRHFDVRHFITGAKSGAGRTRW
jgi:hypothetical protein